MITEPWPHLIIDDFLKPRDLISLQLRCGLFNHEITNHIERTGILKGHYRFKFETDILKEYDVPGYFNQFEQKRPYTELGKLIQLVKTCEETTYPIHDDAPHKIFALLIYIAPHENVGTQIYDADKKLVKQIEWKPNRCVMFCPLSDVTWHGYGSSTDRFTLMYNLVDTAINSKNTIPLEETQ